jgi:uncharacterized integral membrane protein (TIGR00698 family)
VLAGLLLCVAVALGALVFGHLAPLVGAPVFALVLGAVVASMRPPGEAFSPGIRFAGKELLQLAIVLLGATLSLGEIARMGLHSLPVLLGTAIITLAAAYVFGRMLGIDRDLRRLLGVGTTVCGGSAIVALAGVIDVDQADVAYAISTVFLFNIAAVLTFPWIGHALGLSAHAFGLWAGTAINDTSSVVAAGYAFGHGAASEAIIVKLTRTTLIIPLVMFYAGKRLLSARTDTAVRWAAVIPWFILWFVLAAVLNTLRVIPQSAHAPLSTAALFLIVLALAGVGLSTNLSAIRAVGLRPLVLGGVLWIVIACSSLIIARAAHLS